MYFRYIALHLQPRVACQHRLLDFLATLNDKLKVIEMNGILEEHGMEKVLQIISGKDGHPDYSNGEDFLDVNVNGNPYRVYQ